MEIDIITVIKGVLMIVGGATAVLNVVAPMTKSTWDNKVLQFLKKILEVVALNVKDDGTTRVEVIVKNKK